MQIISKFNNIQLYSLLRLGHESPYYALVVRGLVYQLFFRNTNITE